MEVTTDAVRRVKYEQTIALHMQNKALEKRILVSPLSREGTYPEDHGKVCARTGVPPSGNMGGLTCALTCTKPGEQRRVPSHRIVGRGQRDDPDQRATKNWGEATAKTRLDGVRHGRSRGRGGERLVCGRARQRWLITKSVREYSRGSQVRGKWSQVEEG